MHTRRAQEANKHCFGLPAEETQNPCTAPYSSKTNKHLSSSAVGPTMTSPTRQSLIPFLLLWVTILTVVQVAFIVFFFAAGHHGPSQKVSAAAPEPPMPFQANNTPPPPSERGLLLGKGKMLTFEVHSHMKWSAKNPDKGLVSEEKGGRVLKIMRDGYFFLNLQVTLSSCNATGGSQHTVSMKSDDDVILQGRINRYTCSTGLLGKVEELSAGSSLEVHWPTTEELINESLTHLDIIYMNKP
ncbi:uncharacterized protein LOC117735002 [Cyclopterus lumpus]|uniref:uncharacterized protein LOC117735002 n=1 Tax=Cyclopterus lumpus TaxID=8103 RepID=UPI00148611E7|nr:uncharacterized protein LOC117735002 [Cyclopterus lumpus]